MSNSLTALSEKHCRPANLTEKVDSGLFTLEKYTRQGRFLVARAPRKNLPYPEFDPSGLNQSYRDEKTGAELPVFAVFNLEGSPELHAYIGARRKTSFGPTLRLANHLPFARTQKFLETLNHRNLNAWRIAGLGCVLLAAAAAVAVALRDGAGLLHGPGLASSPRTAEAIVQVLASSGVTFVAALLVTGLLAAGIVNTLFPPKTLSLSATFDGLLPKETRDKARRARHLFDQLYLVVDQQTRWKSDLLPVPTSALLDPLLIGEKREQFRSRYYLIDQFELTQAEDYLRAEFLEEQMPRIEK
ncbi:MAG TPA: hypothetical protein VGD78_18555 [Chthoniobacterales bacterium]